MNFVKNHNQYGVEAKEIPCLVSHGEPTEETKGAVGCLYMDEDTGELYKCIAVSVGVYTWAAVEGGGGSGVIVDTDEIVDAVLDALPTWEGGSY